ncbi:hypothetical protein T4D_3570 [Trichinella pseudospiralis]|uniref:Uncharacterized protein n=1 Tax=Trichinella pseudospiralis TaxID=6337 RepID=A0A0V1FJS2_TRIPS|nr:hypothetical protein T4D_3570 [Trichinella pseudospiralis]
MLVTSQLPWKPSLPRQSFCESSGIRAAILNSMRSKCPPPSMRDRVVPTHTTPTSVLNISLSFQLISI